MNKFYEGMAEIFEVEPEAMSAGFDLTTANCDWDSLAIVSTIALVDDCFNVMLRGDALGECKTIGDIEALVAKAGKE
jgi:acyl carrier protein